MNSYYIPGPDQMHLVSARHDQFSFRTIILKNPVEKILCTVAEFVIGIVEEYMILMLLEEPGEVLPAVVVVDDDDPFHLANRYVEV